MQAAELRFAMATARMRMDGPKRATAAAMADCSAQVVRRYEAFSTLVPVTIVLAGALSDGSSSIAAPTRKRL